jgi:hypothetical protein
MTRLYVTRDQAGQITGLSAIAESEDAETANMEDPSVRRFLQDLDLDLVRVLEDVIELLIARGHFRFTDLPPAAQAKLRYRKTVRDQWQSVASPLDDEEALFT